MVDRVVRKRYTATLYSSRTGYQAVLVTHEHVDHLRKDALLQALSDNPALGVWTNGSVA
jgi:L-ascorbate metabolism protein UlaG (beta-lactamase superfamily)